MKLLHQSKKVKKNLQTLDYIKIQMVSDLYRPILMQKLLFELQFFLVSFYSLLMQNFNSSQNNYKFILYGGLLMFRRVIGKLHEYQRIHDPMKQTLLTKGLFLLMAVFYINLAYVLVKLVLETQVTTTILIFYQYLIYLFIGSKLRGLACNSIVEYYMKNVIFRLYDCSYFHLLVALQSNQTQNDFLGKRSTFYRSLMICLTSNIYLFIMSFVYLTREKGEVLKSHAKNLSQWFKLSDVDTRIPIGEWNPKSFKKNEIVHYKDAYYISKSNTNTSHPEELKVVLIQLLFYDVRRSTRMLMLLLFLTVVCLNVATFSSNPTATVLYNVLITLIIVPMMRQPKD